MSAQLTAAPTAQPATPGSAPLMSDPSDVASIVAGIARDVVAPTAHDVDLKSRFPSEGIDALRDARLMSALVPVRFGGRGLAISDVADICRQLGECCGSTAMIFAMHQIQVASIVRHARNSDFFQDYLAELVERQLLLASATSEMSIGGDVRSSICAVERDGSSFALRKQAPVISYGEQADDIMVTARREQDSAASDQVLLLARRDTTTLTRTSDWDALGFRGTCSCGYVLETRGDVRQILPDSYDDIASRTMLPVSHILWSALWLGIATDAVRRARMFIRDAARRKPGSLPAGATRLAEVVALLQSMRSGLYDAIDAYQGIYDDAGALSAIGFALRMNSLKLQSSRFAVDIAAQAMGICGIAGYRRDGKYSVERNLRDAYGAGIMINNDRILGASASMLLVLKDD